MNLFVPGQSSAKRDHPWAFQDRNQSLATYIATNGSTLANHNACDWRDFLWPCKGEQDGRNHLSDSGLFFVSRPSESTTPLIPVLLTRLSQVLGRIQPTRQSLHTTGCQLSSLLHPTTLQSLYILFALTAASPGFSTSYFFSHLPSVFWERRIRFFSYAGPEVKPADGIRPRPHHASFIVCLVEASYSTRKHQLHPESIRPGKKQHRVRLWWLLAPQYINI